MLEFTIFLIIEYVMIFSEQRLEDDAFLKAKRLARQQRIQETIESTSYKPETTELDVYSFEDSQLEDEAFDLLDELGVDNTLTETEPPEPTIEEENTVSITDISPQTLSSPKSKISDLMIGYQVWRVKVVGIESPYIHVYDGTRTWLSVGGVTNIQRDDIVELEVDRIDEDDIQVLNIRDIYRVSDDFLIPDESESMAM